MLTNAVSANQHQTHHSPSRFQVGDLGKKGWSSLAGSNVSSPTDGYGSGGIGGSSNGSNGHSAAQNYQSQSSQSSHRGSRSGADGFGGWNEDTYNNSNSS